MLFIPLKTREFLTVWEPFHILLERFTAKANKTAGNNLVGIRLKALVEMLEQFICVLF